MQNPHSETLKKMLPDGLQVKLAADPYGVARLFAAAQNVFALLRRIAEPYALSIPADAPLKCDDPYGINCEWFGQPHDLAYIEEIEERLSIGEAFLICAPAGQCPNCSALVYHQRTNDVHTALQEARALLDKMDEEAKP